MMDSDKWNRAHSLDACIKCGACTAECPVARVVPGFPGPKALGPDLERFRLEGFWGGETLLESCTNCKTCELTCPSGVNITEMIRSARQQRSESKTLTWQTAGFYLQNPRHRLRNYLLGRAEYLSRTASLFSPLSNTVLGLRPARFLMQGLLGLSAQAPFPYYGKRFRVPFRHDGRNVQQGSLPPKKVVYFPGCLVKYNEARVGEAVIKVLQHNGYEVIVPKFHCCGVPLEANAFFQEANENARHNLALLHPYLEEGQRVIASCSSCGLALKENYPKVPVPGAERIGLQTDDLFEFLWGLYEKGELRTDFQTVQVSLAYHAPCHLKAQGIGTPVVRLLRQIPGLQIEELDAGCCGMSGSYGFKAEKRDISLKVGEALFSRVREGVTRGRFEQVISECGSCRMQIGNAAKAPTLHPIEILLAAYGLS